MSPLIAVALQLALAGAPNPPQTAHPSQPVHAPHVNPPARPHGARPAPPPNSGSSHSAAPVASNRPPTQGSTAQPGARPPDADRGHHHHHGHRDGERRPGGWTGPWAPPGPYVYGVPDPDDGLEVQDPTPVESWDTPVDATGGWSEPEAPPPEDVPPPPGAGPAATAPDDGCTETEDTDVDDSQSPAIYRWLDAQGALHFSDYDLIPPEARKTAVRTSGDAIVVTHKHLRCRPSPAEPPPAQAP